MANLFIAQVIHVIAYKNNKTLILHMEWGLRKNYNIDQDITVTFDLYD